MIDSYFFMNPIRFRKYMRRLSELNIRAAEIGTRQPSQEALLIASQSDSEVEEVHAIRLLRNSYWEYGAPADYFIDLTPNEYARTLKNNANWVLQYADINGEKSRVKVRDLYHANMILQLGPTNIAMTFNHKLRRLYR